MNFDGSKSTPIILNNVSGPNKWLNQFSKLRLCESMPFFEQIWVRIGTEELDNVPQFLFMWFASNGEEVLEMFVG